MAARDPREVAISRFLGGFNAASHPWTTRLDWKVFAWPASEDR